MNKELKEFKEKYCKNCKAICDKGIVETYEDLRCVDRDIHFKKRRIKNEKRV